MSSRGATVTNGKGEEVAWAPRGGGLLNGDSEQDEPTQARSDPPRINNQEGLTVYDPSPSVPRGLGPGFIVSAQQEPSLI